MLCSQVVSKYWHPLNIKIQTTNHAFETKLLLPLFFFFWVNSDALKGQTRRVLDTVELSITKTPQIVIESGG